MLLTDKQLAGLCWQAYQTTPFKLPDGWEYNGSKSDGNGQEAFVLRKGAVACFVFRGTVGFRLRDWIANLAVIKKFTAWGRVHTGAFYRATRLYEELAPHLGGLSHLYLAGHSLGGQSATAMAHLYCRGNRYPVDLVTFGAPKVLSWWAKRRFPEYINVREYLDPRDPVGYIPMLNYWRLNRVRVGRWGFPRVNPWHGSEKYFRTMAEATRRS